MAIDGGMEYFFEAESLSFNLFAQTHESYFARELKRRDPIHQGLTADGGRRTDKGSPANIEE